MLRDWNFSLKAKKNLVTRFAPSPTGFLHLGHLASCLYVWGLAERLGAKVDVRIEDHDGERSRDFYASQILDDLEFFGFLSLPQTRQIYKQSFQNELFEKALNKLQSKNLVYPCSCSRKDILKRGAFIQEELCYDSLCYSKVIDTSKVHTLRLHVKKDEQTFFDYFKGNQTQFVKKQCGDFALKDRKGFWTYQFSCAVSDLETGVNLFIRGEDILPSTGRQIYLRHLLGNKDEIFFFHHPLIQDKNSKKKLSKSENSLSLKEMREQGKSAESLLGEAAYLVGLQETKAPFLLQKMQKFFS